MRMDGDPHLTAWGSMDAEPIGGQRAIDLIPPQVLGGYFLMGTEEKERLPSRRGILDEQGVPILCQGEEPLGVVGGHGKAGEQNAPLTLCSLDSSQDSTQNSPPCCTFELPPETVPTPLSSDPHSEEPDQDIISPIHSPQEDCPSDDPLDVHQLLAPGPALPLETDQLPCSPVSEADTTPMPSDILLDPDESLLFTSEMQQESDCAPLPFVYLSPVSDQIPPAKSSLPHLNDHSLMSEAPLDPCTDPAPQSYARFDPAVVESVVESIFGAVELPQPTLCLESGATQLPQSESCLEPNMVHLPGSTINLACLSQSLPQSECCLDCEVDELPEAETCMDLGSAELPEADSCVTSDGNDLAEAELFMNLDGDWPEAEAFLNLNVSELPESDICLSPGIGDLPEAEGFVVPDVSELPEAESFLDPDVDELPEAEAGLNASSELTESDLANIADYLSQSESCLYSEADQLAQSDSEQLSLVESCLQPNTNPFFCPEPYMHPDSDLLPQSEPCLTIDQLPQIKFHLHSENYILAQPELSEDPSVTHLESSLTPEQFAQSDEIDIRNLPQTVAFLDTENIQPPRLEFCLHPDSLDLQPDQLHPESSFSDSVVDQIPLLSQSESNVASGFKCEPCSAPEPGMLSPVSDFGQSSNHSHIECCANSQSDQVPDSCLLRNTKRFSHCDSSLNLKIDQLSMSDACSQPDPNQSPQSDCASIPKMAHCSQSDASVDTDRLSQSYSYLESEPHTVPFSKSELGRDLSACECPNSGPCIAPAIDHFHQSGLCLDLEIEPLPLSETFLAHENDHLISSVVESNCGLISHSESSATDKISLFSDVTEKEATGSTDTCSDNSVACANPLTSDRALLPVSESSLCDDVEVCLCDTFLALDIDQVYLPSLPESTPPDLFLLCKPVVICDFDQLPDPKTPNIYPLPLPESVLTQDADPLAQLDVPDIDSVPPTDPVLASDIDYCRLGESFLPQDNLPFTVAASSDHLAGLSEPCLELDSGDVLKLESCLNIDNDQVSLSESSLSQNTDEVLLPVLPLSSHTDKVPPSKPIFPVETDDRLSLCNSAVAIAYHLPLLESLLEPDDDSLSEYDFKLDNHLPISDSVLAEDPDQLTQSSVGHLPQSESFYGIDLLPLPECVLAPSLGDLNLSDLCLTSDIDADIDHFPLDMASVGPDTEISLFDELLASEASQSLLSESIVTPPRDELSRLESCLSKDADHSHMPISPHEHQLSFVDSNSPPEEDNIQLCQSSSSNVDQPVSEYFEESNAGQLPQSLSYLARDIDQPETVHRSSLDSTSDFPQITPSNSSFSNSIVEKFHIPWDWTSELDHAQFTGAALDCGSDIYINVSADDPASQVHEVDDSFPLFCLDTPPESPITSPEVDPLTLSDDLLSLCDVFSQLQTIEKTCPEINSELCCALDSLSLHRTDCEAEGSQVPIIEEISPLYESQIENMKRMPTSNVQVNIGDNQTFTGILYHNSDHYIDQSDSYCLELLFEPELAFCETPSSSSSPIVDPCPQLNFDPSSWSVMSANEAGHLLCDVTEPSQYHVYETPSTPPLEGLCFDDHLAPAYKSDSYFQNPQLAQSHSYGITEMGSASELLHISDQLPLIAGGNPLDLLENLTESNQDILFVKSQEALPPDKLVHPNTDNPVQEPKAPLCDVKGPVLLESEGSDHCQVYAIHSGSGEQFPPNDTTQSMPDVSFESSPSLQCGTDEQTENFALSRTASPLENTQVLPCDSHQHANSQDSASLPFSFGEGDPFLGFALDNDSPCVGDELARLRAVFDALDRDKDGFVKMEDFVQFATVYGAEQVKYLTGYLDPAGLGVINFRDFYRGISEIQNEDLDMQLYDMGYPAEGEPVCSVDFDDLAAFEVTEVTDSAYVGSESAYSECETFTDEDTGGLAAHEDQETEGDGAGSRRHTSASPEGLELSLCDISVVTVAGQEEQFEDFGEGAEPDLFNSHCEDETDSFTETSNSTQHLTSSGGPVSERQLLAPPPCSAIGGLYCSQCHKHINRLEDLSTRLRYLEMDSPEKRTCSRKEARRLHHNGFLGEEPEEQQQTEMAYDDTDLTDKVLYLEQRVSELERDAATTCEQQNRLRQENLQLLHRVHALEEQLKDQELHSDEVQSEETRKHRDELRKMERDRSYQLSSLKARLQELENENLELRSQLPSAKATTQRLEEEKQKLLDQVEDLQRQLADHQEQNRKLGGKISKEMHKQQSEKERCQEVIEELRRELEQMQLIRLEMEQKMGVGNTAALQEYNSRTREAELEQEVRRLKQEQRALKEQNEELNGQIINLSIQGAKNLFSTTFSDSLAAEISSVSRDELMEAIHKQEEINLRLQDYIDRIIVAIMETNPAILEVKFH